MHNDTYVAGG